MDTTGEHEAPNPSAPHRPPAPRAAQPPRPDVVVAPLRAPAVDPGPMPHPLTAALTAWAASFAVFTALVGVLATEYGAVADALAAGLADRNPTADPSTVDQATAVSMLGVGGVGMLLVLGAVLAIVRLRAGSGRARGWLTLVAAATVGAAVTAGNLLADASDVAFRIFVWGPPLQAVLVVAGTALLFTPAVSAWLQGRSAR